MTAHRIVVGVDGSRGSAAAVRWVAEHVASLGSGADVEIIAVQVVEPVVPLDFTGAGFAAVSQLDPRRMYDAAHEGIRAVVAANAPALAGRVTELVVEHANPGQALLRAAEGAAMLVVGAHHHHGLGLLLGSTGSGCIRHATRPVVVVPEGWHTTGAAGTAAREEVLA